MFEYKDYPVQLKRARLRSGLTQLEIASEVGISRNYYSEIENGKRKPSMDVLERLNVAIPLIFLGTIVDKSDN